MFTRGVIGTALLVVLLILAGCATTNMSLSERSEAYDQFIVDEELEALDRITTFRFNGWASLSNEHLIVRTGVNRNYLLTLRNNCSELYYSQAIVINQTGRILQTKFDSISVPGDFPLRCFIKSIYKITPEQKKAMLAIGKDREKPVIEEAEQKPAD